LAASAKAEETDLAEASGVTDLLIRPENADTHGRTYI